MFMRQWDRSADACGIGQEVVIGFETEGNVDGPYNVILYRENVEVR